MKHLITGAAGFIGMHLAQRVLQEEHEVVGIDNCHETCSRFDPDAQKNAKSFGHVLRRLSEC